MRLTLRLFFLKIVYFSKNTYIFYIFFKVNFKELKRNNSALSMKCLGFFTSQIWYVFPLELDLQSAQVKPLPKGEFMFAHKNCNYFF